jgi:hypothetical protein
MRRARAASVEIVVAFATSFAFYATCRSIRFAPLDRIGQVSGLAALSYRFLLFAVPIVLATCAVARYRAAWWSMTVRIACAAFAGLASAYLAGGLLSMLRGTPYGLGGDAGDSAVLADWAHRLQLHQDTPGLYPPLQLHLIAWLSDLQGISTLYAIKSFQIVSVLVFGPCAYCTWRLLLRPTWALGIGVVASLPMLEPYRLYPFVVLTTFLPLVIYFLDTLRRAETYRARSLIVRGIACGVAFGLMFLMYSGWFQWSAPGFLIVAVAVFPWRRAPKLGAALCVPALVTFTAITAYSIARVLGAPPIEDYFHYFDSTVDPAFVAMWRGALPGQYEHLWPPIGELGGVGLFTVLLCIGSGISILLGAARTAVFATFAIMAGTWLMRFRYASRMWATHMVQLYPRTTAELLYCLLVLTGFGVFLYAERVRANAAPDHPIRAKTAVIAELCALGLLFMFSGSAITDRYMPRSDELDYAHLAWISHKATREGVNVVGDASVDVASWSARTGYTASAAADGNLATIYTSALSASPDADEFIELHIPWQVSFSSALLVPAPEGFPVDFTIDVWDGTKWITRVSERGYHAPPVPQLFAWGRPDRTDAVRVHVTKLGPVTGGYALALREVELLK